MLWYLSSRGPILQLTGQLLQLGLLCSVDFLEMQRVPSHHSVEGPLLVSRPSSLSFLSFFLTFFLFFLLALARLFGSYSSGRQRLPGGLTWLRYHAAECAPFSVDTKGLPSQACLCCLHGSMTTSMSRTALSPNFSEPRVYL